MGRRRLPGDRFTQDALRRMQERLTSLFELEAWFYGKKVRFVSVICADFNHSDYIGAAGRSISPAFTRVSAETKKNEVTVKEGFRL